MNSSLGVLLGATVIFLFILYFVVESAAQKGTDNSETKKMLEQVLKKLEDKERNK
ncbi:hypothetical protein [Geomicrobium sp. JCM 19038]|uniref:hypothetical protein n=1 Tax=Geomicrobium sp. JCM 19038 TaxID=1460635 RepID=UPI00045F4132|nr:hypothetical protein [Geomicrobium sp. JCM 19038]GAK09150.1 hypothetical protein JCM19038_2971 [Geomicrobium sp. JCM 19038]